MRLLPQMLVKFECDDSPLGLIGDVAVSPRLKFYDSLVVGVTEARGELRLSFLQGFADMFKVVACHGSKSVLGAHGVNALRCLFDPALVGLTARGLVESDNRSVHVPLFPFRDECPTDILRDRIGDGRATVQFIRRCHKTSELLDNGNILW